MIRQMIFVLCGIFYWLFSYVIAVIGSASGQGSAWFSSFSLSPFLWFMPETESVIAWTFLVPLYWALVFVSAGAGGYIQGRIVFLILITLHYAGLLKSPEYFDNWQIVQDSLLYCIPYVVGQVILWAVFVLNVLKRAPSERL